MDDPVGIRGEAGIRAVTTSVVTEGVLDLLRREQSLQAVWRDADRLARRYVVYLVDHSRSSRSTHKFWWNHFEDACQALGIRCLRVPKVSETWPQDHRREGKRGVYLFFTIRSLFHDRMGWLRTVRSGAIRPEDVVASWDPRVIGEFTHSEAFQIGFRSERWMSTHGLADRQRIIVWEPYAPLAALARGIQHPAASEGTWDFAYFGTLNRHNYDQFQRILRPLALRYRCRYGGKLWRIFSPIPLRYGFSPFLASEQQGMEVLMQGRANLILHNDYHRQAQTLTERLFVSLALGRPVVCDNTGARQYFTIEEVPVGEDPETFLALCEDVLRDLRVRQEIAREVQSKVRRHYTYLHTAVQLLADIDSRVSSRSVHPLSEKGKDSPGRYP